MDSTGQLDCAPPHPGRESTARGRLDYEPERQVLDDVAKVNIRLRARRTI